nr:hypothetical protein CFP56_16455 [Quercus suber]
MRFTASLLFSAAGALASTKTKYANCKEVSFSVSGNALVYNITGLVGTNLSSTIPPVQGILEATIPVSGTQNLAGWYCEPIKKNANSTKLQIFRGSFFTNRESWTALGGTDLFNPPLAPYEPELYSSHSRSSDSISVSLETRFQPSTAKLACGIGCPSTIISSRRSAAMAVYYPKDFDALILTGFSIDVLSSFPGVSLNAPAPAVTVDSTRFAGAPAGYVTSTIEQSLTNSFFGDPKFVDFDPKIAHLFFQRRDVVSLGDVVTTYLLNGIPPATTYTGRVIVITGEHDQAYCGLGSSALDPDNEVCPGLLKKTKTLFPVADYNYQVVPRTGHATILHYTAPFTFFVAHRFLAGASFGQ